MAVPFRRPPPADLAAIAAARMGRLASGGTARDEANRSPGGWVPATLAGPAEPSGASGIGHPRLPLAGAELEDDDAALEDDDGGDLTPPPGWLPGVVTVGEGNGPAGRPASAPRPSAAGLTAAVRGALADRLPASLRGGRLDLRRQGVLALALVATLAALVAGWSLLRSRPAPVAAPMRPKIVAPATSSSPTPTGVVIVDVVGKVARPGLVTLPAGSRVAEAIQAAGGLLPGADSGLLNLASKLSDGQQVLVGVAAPASEAGSAAGGGADPVLDLNTATEAQLETLPGVGPVLATRIADWRRQHGSFASVDQLREVSGIGDRKFAELRPKVRT